MTIRWEWIAVQVLFRPEAGVSRRSVRAEQVEEAGARGAVSMESWSGVGQVMEGSEHKESIILMPYVVESLFRS